MDQALADLDQAIAIDADQLAARYKRGAMRYGAGDLEGALEDFDRCIVLATDLPGPYFNGAAVQDARGEGEAAIADLERFLRISTNEYWNRQARELLQALRAPDAIPAQPAPNPHH